MTADDEKRLAEIRSGMDFPATFDDEPERDDEFLLRLLDEATRRRDDWRCCAERIVEILRAWDSDLKDTGIALFRAVKDRT